MKTIQTFALMSSLSSGIAFAETVNFDDLTTGAPPPGWTAPKTGNVAAKRTNPKVASNKWHTLRVDFRDKYFTVTFDGKKAFTWKDDTFKDAGKVGLWTKADSTTLFDDFTYGTDTRKLSAADEAQLEKES